MDLASSFATGQLKGCAGGGAGRESEDLSINIQTQGVDGAVDQRRFQVKPHRDLKSAIAEKSIAYPGSALKLIEHFLRNPQ